MCIRVHPTTPSEGGEGETFFPLFVTHMSLGSSMDFYVSHAYDCLNPSVIDLDSVWKASTEQWGNWARNEQHQA